MKMKYAVPALVGIALVVAAFTVDQSEIMREALAVAMTIIGMALFIWGVVAGMFDDVGHRNQRQGDREDT